MCFFLVASSSAIRTRYSALSAVLSADAASDSFQLRIRSRFSLSTVLFTVSGTSVVLTARLVVKEIVREFEPAEPSVLLGELRSELLSLTTIMLSAILTSGPAVSKDRVSTHQRALPSYLYW